MMHVIMPSVILTTGLIHDAYQIVLRDWFEEAITKIDSGDVAASTCLQGAFIDLARDGRFTYDWMGILDEYLLESNIPLAYSVVYGERLFGFGNQVKQTTIHAIHTRWWIECFTKGCSEVDHEKYAEIIIRKKVASDGLIYDFDVSPTIMRHRMKTELTMSVALAVQILIAAKGLTEGFARQLATDLTDPTKCPPTGYMSAEYFRLHALDDLSSRSLFPVHSIESAIAACESSLDVGFCDFSMESKVDAYMGTSKRTARDAPIHSPLTACHVGYLKSLVTDETAKQNIDTRLLAYVSHLKANPMDIPAFQMRDVPIQFGADKTPIELLCASHLISEVS
jgi:hypothetical protein